MSACSSLDGDACESACPDAAPQLALSASSRWRQWRCPSADQMELGGAPLASSQEAPPAPDAEQAAPLRIDLFVSSSGAPGAPASVVLSTSEAAFAYCYLNDVNGAIMQVFPNRWQSDALLRPDQTTEVPAPGAGFRIVLPEQGQERIVCFASRSEIAQGLPQGLRPGDLTPLPVRDFDELAAIMRQEAERSASDLVVNTRVLRPDR
jgi:hypothetical protein